MIAVAVSYRCWLLFVAGYVVALLLSAAVYGCRVCCCCGCGCWLLLLAVAGCIVAEAVA